MNFRIGQKVRCIESNISSFYISQDKPLEDRIYTVLFRQSLDGQPFVVLSDIIGASPFGFPSKYFVCAEIMEEAEKAAKDLGFTITINNTKHFKQR